MRLASVQRDVAYTHFHSKADCCEEREPAGFSRHSLPSAAQSENLPQRAPDGAHHQDRRGGCTCTDTVALRQHVLLFSCVLLFILFRILPPSVLCNSRSEEVFFLFCFCSCGCKHIFIIIYLVSCFQLLRHSSLTLRKESKSLEVYNRDNEVLSNKENQQTDQDREG